jgi:hypothetical protein
MSQGLKPGAPLVFTYHHNDPEAYVPIIVAILDAGLNCTGDLAAPAEMSASLHISGTGSSIVDTIFVCRHKGVNLDDPLSELAEPIEGLREGGVDISEGDLQCITMGHLAQRATNRLYGDWDKSIPLQDRLKKAQTTLDEILDDYPVDALVTDLNQDSAVSAQDGHAVQGGTNGR